MPILLSHTTALEALRSVSLKRRLERGERASIPLPESSPSMGEIETARDQFPLLTLPIHVCATRRGHVVPPRLAFVHRSRVPLPAGSVIRLSDDVYCTSPEYLVVQMAPSLTRLELIFLLGELLGTYAIAPDSEDGMFERRVPLTTRARVLAHLDALGPVPGTAQVRSALAEACEGSASPYETRLSMRLGLKPSLGGYHLRVLSMNAPLEVMRIGSALGPGVRRPDVLLGATSVHAPFSGVSFDYNGGIHKTPEAFERDARRRTPRLHGRHRGAGTGRPRHERTAPHQRRGGEQAGETCVAARRARAHRRRPLERTRARAPRGPGELVRGAASRDGPRRGVRARVGRDLRKSPSLSLCNLKIAALVSERPRNLRPCPVPF